MCDLPRRDVWLGIARRGINPTAIPTKAAQSRLVRISGLCTAKRSTVVYHRASSQGRINPSKQENTKE